MVPIVILEFYAILRLEECGGQHAVETILEIAFQREVDTVVTAYGYIINNK